MLEGQTGGSIDTERLAGLLGEVEAQIASMSEALRVLRDSVAGIHAALPAVRPAGPSTPVDTQAWSFAPDQAPGPWEPAQPEHDDQAEPDAKPTLSLSSGWPDESLWSQDFEWPAMKTSQPPDWDASHAGQPDGWQFAQHDLVPANQDPAQDAWSDHSAAGAPVSEPDGPALARSEAEDARRDAVTRAVEQMRAELAERFGEANSWLAESEPEAASEDSSDQAFAAMIRAGRPGFHESSDNANGDWQANLPQPTFATTETAGAADGAPDDEAAREAVRRAVEMARAEMSSGSGRNGTRPLDLAEPAQAPSPGGFSDWTSMAPDVAGPPVIVIKDREGRVELARVFETLNRVNCGDNAALLNYTPHSVTVGLPLRAPVPARESLFHAVQAVFGRACSIESDGVRISVDLSAGSERREGAA